MMYDLRVKIGVWHTGPGITAINFDQPEFKFWENIFDGLKFFYDHLNIEWDIAKEKSVGP